MAHWQDYTLGRPAHTVAGTLLIREHVYSPQLHNRRSLLVWLPGSYARQPQRRYPVIYMQDGQNLFDAFTSFAGEWQVDETMIRLEDEGLEAIIVGIPNNDRRIFEYSPYPDHRLQVKEGQGEAYLTWLTQTVKPLIDHDFRTLPDRAHTGIAGSSMGGLISLYGFLRYGHCFGLAGVFSPAYWFGNRAIFQTVEQAAVPAGRLYLDIGSEEGDVSRRRKPDAPNYYLLAVRQLSEALIRKGCTPGDTLFYVEDQGGQHNEDAWARRLPQALRFLLREPLRDGQPA
ncbi:MAG: alpha/beta hydrolase-fold protein [Anaerolineae bacterium]|nr:alpha/beta hydrolase-fold protein [Anaerolineae bacterium]